MTHLVQKLDEFVERFEALIGVVLQPRLEGEFDLETVAASIDMSERWVRIKIAEGASHQRYGNKIRFTTQQVAELRAAHTQPVPSPVQQSITTGRKKSVR